MNIQEAIKEKTVIRCETESEAKRILNMAHKLGYRWWTDRSYLEDNEWSLYRKNTCYYIHDGTYSSHSYYALIKKYKIINSTDITDMITTTDWTPAPEDLLDMKQELTITPPSGFEIDEEKSTFQKIVFRKIVSKFPTKLEEIDRPWYIGSIGRIVDGEDGYTQTPNHLTSKESAEQALEFIKLLAFRDAIWEIEGEPKNTGIDISFNFKTNEGAEHFEKIRREIDLD